MTVEQLDVVDIVSTDKNDNVVLTISDHLDWSDSGHHQTILQAKLNKYLAFVESGEIFERYPSAKGKCVVFSVVFKFKPDINGRRFLKHAQKVIESAGFDLKHEVFAESYDN